MFFSIILISLALSPCYSTFSDKVPSDYLFGNTNLITKADFLEAFEFDSKGLNRNLAAMSLGHNRNFPDIPFALYIKKNYFGLFESPYLKAKKHRTNGHLFGTIWKKIYEKMLEKTDYQDSYAAFKRLFGDCSLYGDNPEVMCTRLKSQLQKLHKEWDFIFKKGAFGETKFAVTFAYLIFKHLNPSDKSPDHSMSNTSPRTSLDSYYFPLEYPRKAGLYGSISPDDVDSPKTPIILELCEPMTTIYFSKANSDKKVEEENNGTGNKRTRITKKNVKNSKQKKFTNVDAPTASHNRYVSYSFCSHDKFINTLNTVTPLTGSQFNQQKDLNVSNNQQVELCPPRTPDFSLSTNNPVSYDRCVSIFDPPSVSNSPTSPTENQKPETQAFYCPYDFQEYIVPNTKSPSCSINLSPPVDMLVNEFLPLDPELFPESNNMDVLSSSSQSATISVDGDSPIETGGNYQSDCLFEFLFPDLFLH